MMTLTYCRVNKGRPCIFKNKEIVVMPFEGPNMQEMGKLTDDLRF